MPCINKVFIFPEREPKPPPSSRDWKEEFEACKYWDRPARASLDSNPFYPWMPREPPTCRVTFKLGWK